MLVMTQEDGNQPLAHPFLGFILQYILDLARNNTKSVALTNVVHSLPTRGWAFFPNIAYDGDSFIILHLDIVTLFGYDPTKQVGIVHKINTFIGHIGHRAVVDMVRMRCSFALADMWFKSNVPKQQRHKCNEVHVCPSPFSTLHCCFLVHMSTSCTGVLIVIVHLQVSTSSISIHEDVDIGLAFTRDLHKKTLVSCLYKLRSRNCSWHFAPPT